MSRHPIVHRPPVALAAFALAAFALAAFALAGCAESGPPHGIPYTGSPTTLDVQGAFDGWPGATGDELAAAVNVGGHYTELGTAPIDASGHFLLSVPIVAAAAYEQPLAFYFMPVDFGIQCSFTPPVPATLTLAMIDLFVKDPSGKRIAAHDTMGNAYRFLSTQMGGAYMGAQTCDGDPANDLSFDLSLKIGSNVLRYDVAADGSSRVSSGAVEIPLHLTAVF